MLTPQRDNVKLNGLMQN